MQTATEQQQDSERPVWSWRFDETEDLQAALAEYTSFLDGTFTRHYGAREDVWGEADPKLVMHATLRRSEIDACMAILEQTYPFYHRLLDLFYRTGMSAEHGAWKLAAQRLGLRSAKCPSLVRCDLAGEGDERRDLKGCKAMIKLACRWDRDTFDAQLREGVGRLMFVHNRRWDKMQKGKKGPGT